MNQAFYYSIASSSKGNCGLLVAGNTRILIDFGVSLRKLTAALAPLGLSVANLSAVVITHEHGDHIRGLTTFSKHHSVPVYVSGGSREGVLAMAPLLEKQLISFSPEETLLFPDMTLHSFATPHDSAESVGFLFEGAGFRFGFATDIGFLPTSVKKRLLGCDMVVLEANHDKMMLQNGPYPYPLKRRVAGSHGHLSNDDCALFALELFESGTKKVLLAHLSENNNTPDLAFETVNSFLLQNGLSVGNALLVAPVGCGEKPIIIQEAQPCLV